MWFNRYLIDNLIDTYYNYNLNNKNIVLWLYYRIQLFTVLRITYKRAVSMKKTLEFIKITK